MGCDDLGAGWLWAGCEGLGVEALEAGCDGWGAAELLAGCEVAGALELAPPDPHDPAELREISTHLSWPDTGVV